MPAPGGCGAGMPCSTTPTRHRFHPQRGPDHATAAPKPPNPAQPDTRRNGHPGPHPAPRLHRPAGASVGRPARCGADGANDSPRTPGDPHRVGDMGVSAGSGCRHIADTEWITTARAPWASAQGCQGVATPAPTDRPTGVMTQRHIYDSEVSRRCGTARSGHDTPEPAAATDARLAPLLFHPVARLAAARTGRMSRLRHQLQRARPDGSWPLRAGRGQPVPMSGSQSDGVWGSGR